MYYDDQSCDSVVAAELNRTRGCLLIQGMHCISLQTQLTKINSELIAKNNELIELKNELRLEKLTGLLTRHYLEKEVEAMSAQIRRRRPSSSTGVFGVAMIDLDFFKTINDTFGHHCGDEVLRVFGSTILDCVRGLKAVACRWGGDEFLLLFKGVTKRYIKSFVKKLRTAFEGVELSFNRGLPPEKQVRPSFSYGFALQTVEKKSFYSLQQEADLDMYARRRIQRR